MRGRTALVLGVAVLVAGCQLHADVDLRLDRQGGGTLSVALEIDEALDEEAREAGFDFAESVRSAVDGLDGWEAEASQRGVRLTTRADGPEELHSTTAALADALEGPELRPLEPFDVVVTGERLEVRGAAGLEPTGAVADMGLDQPEALELLEQGVVYTVSVEMPGEVTGHDADRQDGQRLVWDVPAGERVELTAEAQLPAEPFGAVLVAFLGGALVVILLVWTWRRRRRRQRMFA